MKPELLENETRGQQTSDREPQSLSEQAYQRLVHLITSLELAPGSVVVDKWLMSELGIGRTPIREALQRLAAEGLVVHRPNRGMFVADITAGGVQQIYEFRSLIDRHLVRLAAERATPSQIEELRALQAQLRSTSKKGDTDRYVELDRRFYDVLTRAARNDYLAEVVTRIFHLHIRLWYFILAQKGGMASVATAHAAMASAVVGAIVDRNADAAEAAIGAYISRRHLDMKELL